MDEETRAEYRRKGAIEMTLQEWLGLTEIDCEVIELRVRIAMEVRRRRAAPGEIQEEFASRCGTTRSILNRIENGAETSYNRMMNVYFD